MSSNSQGQLDITQATYTLNQSVSLESQALAFHALVLNSMTEGVSVADEKGFIVYTNPAEEAMFGYVPGELVGKHVTVQNAYPEEENARLVDIVIGELKLKGVWEGEWHNRRKDGSTFYTKSRITALEQNGKKFWVCVQRDITQQKSEHESLNNAERFLGLLFESISDHLVSYDRQWRYTHVNNGAVKLLGKKREELIGRSIWEVFPEAVGNQYYRELHDALETQQSFLSEHYYAPWDAWLENHFYPTADGVTVFSSDITERKRIQVAYLESESRLQLALTAGKMGAWQWHIQKGESSWMQGMAELHGLPPDSAINSVGSYMHLVYPEDRPILEDKIRQGLASKSGYVHEYRIVWPDGTVRWLEGHAKLLLDDHGEPEEMTGICVDVTSRKRLEQDLKFVAQASAELASFVDRQSTLDKVAQLAVPTFADWCSVDLLEENGTLQRVAVAHKDVEKVQLAHELHRRYPPDPAAPGGTWQVLRTGKAELVPEITDEMLEQSIKDPEYLTAIRALGLKSYIGAPLASCGKTVGVITFISAESKRLYSADDLALAEDLAKRAAVALRNAELYQALKQSDRSKDEFLAMLAHELRNPLAPISAAAALMQMVQLDAEQLQQTSTIINRQIRHMTGLIDDLMDVSRVTRGLITLNKVKLDIKRVISDAVEQVNLLMQSKRHQLNLELAPEAANVLGDHKRLVQILTNLLNNAAKYTTEGGEICLKMKVQENAVLLSIIDNGIGITSDLQPRIFDLFTQGKRDADRSQGGLGIGLALVKSLVDLHQGSITCASAGIGQGSHFTVTLPKAEIEENFADGRFYGYSGTAITGKKLRIMVVDDNADAAKMLSFYLQAAGHDILMEHSAKQGLERAIVEKPDVCILDIGLPEMDGNELARQLRAHPETARTLLIAATGYGQEQDKENALKAGFDYHLVKPVDPPTLLALLARSGKYQ